MSTLLSLFMFAVTSPTHGQEIYHRKKNPGVKTYVTDYGISGSWLLECTEQTSGRGAGTKWCRLLPTKKERYRSGIYRSTDGIIVELWNQHDRDPEVLIKLSLVTREGDTIAISVGGKRYSKEAGRGPTDKEMRGEEAIRVIPSLIKESVGRWEYVSARGKSLSGGISLLGFTDVWNYAVDFVGYSVPF